jgi:hypothetical protein
MRVIKRNIYTFDELSKEAQEKAITNIRDSYYEYNDFAQWAIDDCALLEPNEKELVEILKSEYDFPLIKNNRKVYYDLDHDELNIKEAMEIQNSTHFLKWLGLNIRLIDKCDYTILENSISFSNQSFIDFTKLEEKALLSAQSKFKKHCKEIFNRIKNDYEYRFTDEAIIDDIKSNDYEFYSNGQRYTEIPNS